MISLKSLTVIDGVIATGCVGTVHPNLQQEKGIGHISAGTEEYINAILFRQIIIVLNSHCYSNNNNITTIKGSVSHVPDREVRTLYALSPSVLT